MEIIYPKYPFLWNYNDMFSLIEFNAIKINKKYNEETVKLSELFNDKNIIMLTQKINKENINNMILNIQTTCLDKLNIFESNETSIKVISNYKINYIDHPKIFVYDPYNNIKIGSFNAKKICIVKNFDTIVKNINNIPLLYTRTHTVKGIIRFSPSNNSNILLKEDIENAQFFTITENTIVLNNIIIV